MATGSTPLAELPGYDLWMTYVGEHMPCTLNAIRMAGTHIYVDQIKNIHILPASLEAGRFRAALRTDIRHCPHAAGRPVRGGDAQWLVSSSS